MDQLISVIVPAYNAERHLKECLDSLLAQTYQRIEVIIVDDGSTDRTAQICKEYTEKDKRIVYVFQKNQGVSEARNHGIQVAKGDYLGFVDADDKIHPDMYGYLLKILLENDADLSTVEIADDIHYDLGSNRCKEEILSQEEMAKIFFKVGSQKIIYYVWNRLYKREIFQEKEYFDKRFSIGEDVIASYKAIIRSKKIVVSSCPMYFYRKDSGVTSSFNKKYFQLIDVWEEVRRITENIIPQYLEYVYINQARINFTLLTELALSGAYKEAKYKNNVTMLVKQLKKEKQRLLKSDIALSRKILIVLFCTNYKLAAKVLSAIKIERQ